MEELGQKYGVVTKKINSRLVNKTERFNWFKSSIANYLGKFS